MVPEVYSEQFFRALQALFVAGIAGYAFQTAKEAALNHGRWRSASRSLAWCLGLAAFAAVVMGEPSCEENGDPPRGGCEVYADDGYEPSFDDRMARFIFFAMILTIPALVGVSKADDREIARRAKEREAWSQAYDNTRLSESKSNADQQP